MKTARKRFAAVSIRRGLLRNVLACAALPVMIATLLTLPARADDRMAGASPVLGVSAASYPATIRKGETPPAILPVNLDNLEARGLLDTPKNGSLGIDLWDNSDYDTLRKLIGELPQKSEYATLFDLSRRALLTQIDPTLINGRNKNAEKTGNDFLTLRIEKLTAMGKFGEAAALYGQNPSEPYHEHFARGGILAMFYSGKAALACLEINAVKDRFLPAPFWQKASTICDALIAAGLGPEAKDALKAVRVEEKSDESAMDSDEKSNAPDKENKTSKDDHDKDGKAAESKGPQTDGEESKLLSAYIENSKKMLTLRKPADLDELSPLEKAYLFAAHSISYAKLSVKQAESLSAPDRALVLNDKNLPDSLRYLLLSKQATYDRTALTQLESFYNKEGEAQYKKQRDAKAALENGGWQALALAYYILSEDKFSTINVDKSALLDLILSGDYDRRQMAARYPFAQYIAEKDIEKSLSQSALDNGLHVMLLTSTDIPESWAEKWGKAESAAKTISSDTLFTYMAYQVANSFEQTNILPAKTIENAYKALNPSQQAILQIIGKKLDKHRKLHNYVANDFYENKISLTTGVNYVIPTSGVMNSLREASKDNSLGEVILLASIALDKVPPGNIYSDTLEDVIDTFVTVGLIEKARETTIEVLLGQNIRRKQ